MCQNEEQRIIKELLVFLKDETFQVGSRLSSERNLAEQFKTSRSTLRNAFKTLMANGILEVKPGSGYYLKTKDKLDDLLNQHQPDKKNQISESLEAFYLFEPQAVALATERMSTEALKSLEVCIVDLSKAILVPNFDKIVESHKRFHHIIVQALGNDFIVKTLQRFELTYVMVSNMMSQASIEQRNRLFALHVNQFKAIKDRNPERAKTASEEMIMSTSVLLAHYEGIKIPRLINDKLKVKLQHDF